MKGTCHYGRLNIIIYVVSILSVGNYALAGSSENYNQLKFQAGYRVDNLDWNIAGNLNGTNPNILSELTWSDLKIFQINHEGYILFGKRDSSALKLKWNLGGGFIVDGDNQDSDYFGDNRSFEFSRSNNISDDGFMIDTAIGIGPQFSHMNRRFYWSILFGLSYHGQDLTMSDGYQTIDTISNNVGPFPGLDSTYEAKWWGAWIGTDLKFSPWSNMNLLVLYEFHLVEYEAEANWNLRSDFAHPVSFEHWGTGDFGLTDGYGMVGGVVAEIKLYEDWYLSLEGKYKRFQLKNGIDRVYFSNGTIGDTRLNEVNWNSWSAMVGISYQFR